jgi:organic hydroperoxide reductase OsmC/OhrA
MQYMEHSHHYRATCSWSGSTGAGYDAYDRTHRCTAPPAREALDLASDPSFLGRPELLNPEQLLLVAASSCQLLSFLAVASRARIDVVGYEDDAEAVMPDSSRPMRITEVFLRPHITIKGDVRVERVAALVEIAHRECFIANSLASRVTVTPIVETVSAERDD